MSDEDLMGDVVERFEWDERKDEDSPHKRLKQVTRRTALTGGAAGIAALALQACGSSGGSKSTTAKAATTGGGSAAASIFGATPKYHFVMVNHVTTNPFFTPTQYGAADACKLLGCTYTWTGSSTSSVGQMTSAIEDAITSKADGIATTLISETAFNRPVAKAMAAGIPVVSYNADVTTVDRLSYIGQDLFQAGVEMGDMIAKLVPSGLIGLAIATPGSLNIQPRYDGAVSVLKKHSGITVQEINSGAAVAQELTTIESWATGHSSAKGMFAVDAGSTQSIAQTLLKKGLRAKGWKGGGFDLTTVTQTLLKNGDLDFTIDQQPYLQGFLPIVQLFTYLASKKLTGPATTDTGLKFITKSTVGPYVSSKSRFEGTSTAAGVTSA